MDPVIISLVLGAAGTGFGAMQAYVALRQYLAYKQQFKLQEEQQAGKAEPHISQPVLSLGQQPASFSSEVSSHQQWKDILRLVLQSEIPIQLCSINIFDHSILTNSINRVRNNPSFEQRIRIAHALDNVVAQKSLPSRQVGLLDLKLEKYLLNEKRPVSVAFPIIMLATTAIFFLLKQRFNLRLNYMTPHAIELAKRVENGDMRPDVCVLGDAPALRFLNKEKVTTYDFFMLMPQCEQRIIAPRVEGYDYNKKSLWEGKYHFISDETSTLLFQAEAFQRQGKINKNRMQTENSEPHQAVSILRSKDNEKRLILWTPHWQILSLLGEGVVLGNSEGSYFYDCMLFLKQAFLKRSPTNCAEALITAVRYAWAKLLSDEDCFEATINQMLDDDDYVEAMKFICGFPQLQQVPKGPVSY